METEQNQSKEEVGISDELIIKKCNEKILSLMQDVESYEELTKDKSWYQASTEDEFLRNRSLYRKVNGARLSLDDLQFFIEQNYHQKGKKIKCFVHKKSTFALKYKVKKEFVLYIDEEIYWIANLFNGSGSMGFNDYDLFKILESYFT